MSEKKETILKNVSLGTVVSIMVLCVSLVAWFIRLESGVSNNAEKIYDHTQSIATLQIDGNGLSDRMARIETKLDILIEQLQK